MMSAYFKKKGETNRRPQHDHDFSIIGGIELLEYDADFQEFWGEWMKQAV
jgi:hypothetical protein